MDISIISSNRRPSLYGWISLTCNYLHNIHFDKLKVVESEFNFFSIFIVCSHVPHRIASHWFMHTQKIIEFVLSCLTSAPSHRPLPITGRAHYDIRLNACNSASFNLNLFVFCEACVRVALVLSCSLLTKSNKWLWLFFFFGFRFRIFFSSKKKFNRLRFRLIFRYLSCSWAFTICF